MSSEFSGIQEILSPRTITLSSMSGNRYHWEFNLNWEVPAGGKRAVWVADVAPRWVFH